MRLSFPWCSAHGFAPPGLLCAPQVNHRGREVPDGSLGAPDNRALEDPGGVTFPSPPMLISPLPHLVIIRSRQTLGTLEHYPQWAGLHIPANAPRVASLRGGLSLCLREWKIENVKNRWHGRPW